MERSYTPSGIFLIVHRCQIDGCKQNSSRFTIQDSNEIGAKILIVLHKIFIIYAEVSGKNFDTHSARSGARKAVHSKRQIKSKWTQGFRDAWRMFWLSIRDGS